MLVSNAWAARVGLHEGVRVLFCPVDDLHSEFCYSRWGWPIPVDGSLGSWSSTPRQAAVNLRTYTYTSPSSALHNRGYSRGGVTSVFRFACWSCVLSAAEKSGPGSKTCWSSTATGTHLLGSRL